MILNNSTFNISTKLTKSGKEQLRNKGYLDIRSFSLGDSEVDYQDLANIQLVQMYETAEVDINNLGSMLVHIDTVLPSIDITTSSNKINIDNLLYKVDEGRSYITIINLSNTVIYLSSINSAGLGTPLKKTEELVYQINETITEIYYSDINENSIPLDLYIIDNRTNKGYHITT